jgi:hypothetical protein
LAAGLALRIPAEKCMFVFNIVIKKLLSHITSLQKPKLAGPGYFERIRIRPLKKQDPVPLLSTVMTKRAKGFFMVCLTA